MPAVLRERQVPVQQVETIKRVKRKESKYEFMSDDISYETGTGYALGT